MNSSADFQFQAVGISDYACPADHPAHARWRDNGQGLPDCWDATQLVLLHHREKSRGNCRNAVSQTIC